MWLLDVPVKAVHTLGELYEIGHAAQVQRNNQYGPRVIDAHVFMESGTDMQVTDSCRG